MDELLTAEWLDSKGFKEVYNYKEHDGLIRRSRDCEPDKDPKVSANVFSFDSRPDKLVCMHNVRIDIRYIHQFELLYLAHTGDTI